MYIIYKNFFFNFLQVFYICYNHQLYKLEISTQIDSTGIENLHINNNIILNFIKGVFVQKTIFQPVSHYEVSMNKKICGSRREK